MLGGRPLEPVGVIPRKQVDVAIAVVFDGAHDKLLVCRRKADAVLGGYWEFPGGKWEPGETAAQCAVREVREETGLDVRVLHALPPIDHEYPHAHVRLHPLVCELTGGQLQLLAVAEARWIAPMQVGSYRFPAANGPLVTRIAAGFAGLLPDAASAGG